MTDTWDKTAINNLLGETEDYKREFKQAGWVIGKPRNIRNDAISKAVSAFANADGGNLILGIEEKGAVAHKVTPLDENIFSKEQLQQIIDHNIQPKIEGLIIHHVEWDATKHEVVYVIEIPRSYMAHQAKDLKYYQRRSGATTEPMTHSEIVDVMGRGQHPKIKLKFDFLIEKTAYFRQSRQEEGTFTKYYLRIIAYNKGSIYANYLNAYFEIPKWILHMPDNSFTRHLHEEEYYIDELRKEYKTIYAENSQWSVIHSAPEPRDGFPIIRPDKEPDKFEPLLPDRWHIWLIEVREDIQEVDLSELEVQWEIYADNSGRKSERIQLTDINFTEIEQVL